VDGRREEEAMAAASAIGGGSSASGKGGQDLQRERHGRSEPRSHAARLGDGKGGAVRAAPAETPGDGDGGEVRSGEVERGRMGAGAQFSQRACILSIGVYGWVSADR